MGEVSQLMRFQQIMKYSRQKATDWWRQEGRSQTPAAGSSADTTACWLVGPQTAFNIQSLKQDRRWESRKREALAAAAATAGFRSLLAGFWISYKGNWSMCWELVSPQEKESVGLPVNTILLTSPPSHCILIVFALLYIGKLWGVRDPAITVCSDFNTSRWLECRPYCENLKGMQGKKKIFPLETFWEGTG